MVASLLLLLALQAQDPVRVRAQLNDTEVQVGQVVAFRVEVETDGPRARIQPFASLPPGLELAGTRDSDHRQFSVPGGVRRFITREFNLRPTAPGRYQIPAVTVVVEGDRYSTEPVVLTVSAGPAAGPAGGTLAEGDVALDARVDADTIYVGEQVTLSVEARFSHDARLRLRRAPEYEPPTTSGFWVHDIPDRAVPANRGVRGEVYEIQTFRRAFFPMSPGHYEIPPARLFYELRRGILHAPEVFTVESDPVPLVVLPLPEADAPPGFVGAVGRYTMRGWLEPSRVAAGEATVLTVELEGVGNVKALPPPRLPDIPGVEVFPPGEEADVEISGTTVRGTKRFSWVLIPREAGEVSVPEITYAFFDPEREAFVRATVAPPPLVVERGAARAAATPSATVRYLQPRPRPVTALAWVRSPWFAAAQLAPLLFVVGVLVIRRRRRRPGRPSAFALGRQRRRAIRDLEDRAGRDDAEFFAVAAATARSWVALRLDLEPTVADRAEALADAGVSAGTARSFRALLDRLAAGRYAPTSPDPAARHELVRQLAAVLERIDREGRRGRASRPFGRGRAAAVVVALLALGAAPSAGGLPAQSAAAPFESDGTVTEVSATSFQRGVDLFDGDEYRAAATAFERYLSDQPRDAAGWYNLGTARFRAGQRGHAVWAWLHAVRLDPRDNDSRHNLRVAGAAPELVGRVTPPVPLRTEELILLAALAWFTAGAAGGWWLLGRRRAAAGLVALGLTVSLGAAGAAWHSTRASEILIMVESAPLRAGPNLHAETVASLEPGAGAVPVDRHGEWIRARTLAGDEGWLEASSARSIATP